MIRGISAVFLLLALSLASAPVTAAEDVSSDRISGAPLTAPKSVLKALNSPLLQKQGVSGARLRYAAEDDAAVLRQWLRSEGYLDAVVEAATDADGALIWRVRAGELWHISSLDITPAPAADVVLPKADDVFRSADYAQAKISLRGAWVDRGYLKADFAESTVIPDHHNKTVKILWRLSPGPLFTISALQVRGAVQYDPMLAQRLSLLEIGQAPGMQLIRNAIRNISNDSHYKSAVITPLPDEARDGRAAIRIDVVEQASRELTGDVGYSTDTGLALGAGWLDRGLMQGNLEYEMQALWSQTTAGLSLAVSRPAWPGVRDRIGVELDYLREDTSGQRFNTISGGPFWRHDFARFDFVKVSVQQNQINGTSERLRLLQAELQLHMDRRLGQGLPHDGWRLDAGLSAPVQTNGGGRWLLAKAAGRYYQAIGEWLLLAPRIGYGRSISLQGTVPKALRQYLGGAGNVRGYKLDSIGPTDADGLAGGGLSAAYAGLDLVIAPAKRFSPVLFSDVGKIWGVNAGKASPVYSVGVGLMIRTPAGPVRIDVSRPLQRRAQDAGFQIYFSLGEVL